MDFIEIFRSFLIFPGGLFAIALGLILLGIDRKVYARLQRRVGPPLYQPFIDIVKLVRKEMVIPKTAHFGAFMLSELIGFAGMLVAVLLIPISGVFDAFESLGDMLVVLYLLALPAISLMLAGSSSSSPYGAVGFSREMMMMIAYELILLVVMLCIAYKVGYATGDTAVFSLNVIMQYQLTHGSFLFDWTMIPAFVAFLMFIPGIIGTVPFDIAEAETEVLEGPILEYSGSGLALFNLMSALKLIVVLGLGIVLFFPMTLGDSMIVNMIWFFVKCLILMTVAITVVRAATGRMRVEQAFRFYLGIPLILSFISLALTVYQV
jgi:formate hydrogenlyase subunit 4